MLPLAQDLTYRVVCYPHHDGTAGLTFAYVLVHFSSGNVRTDQNGVVDAGAFTPAALPRTFVCRAVHRRARRVADVYLTRIERNQYAGTPRWTLLRYPIHLRWLAARHAGQPAIMPPRLP